jgi:hypothetical protein
MKNGILSGIIIVLIASLVILGQLRWIQQSKEFDLLAQELSALKQSQAELINRQQSSSVVALQSAIGDLYAQIDTMNSLIHKRPDTATNAIHSNSSAAAGQDNLSNNARTSLTDLGDTSPVFAKLTEKGYIYPEDWQEIDTDFRTMSKEENELFWQNFIAAMQSGEIEIFETPQ